MSSRWATAVRSSGLWRFVATGVDDAIARLAQLTARERSADADVIRVVEASSAVAAIEHTVEVLAASARSSIVVERATAYRNAWLSQPVVARVRGAGVVLLIAATVHLALTLWQGPIAGWLWLVIPAVALGFGALFALAPSRGLGDHPLR